VDVNQAIRAFVLDEITGVHVGEDVPQNISTNFIWFMRSGDVYDDQLNHPPELIAITFNFECVSQSLSQARSLAEEVKQAFRACPIHSITFDVDDSHENTIQGFDVENHDDSYFAHNTQKDSRLHVGSFLLTAYVGEMRETV
jgi:hypothetical protein